MSPLDSGGGRPAPTILVMAALVLVLVAPPSGAQDVPADTVGIIKADETPSNAEIAVRLSEETPLADVDAVLIGRDDEFADSLASGVLQSDSPLLLVPSAGPVPDRVRAELARIAPSRVVLLGGEVALHPAVADEIAGLGYAVERREGPSRFETAIDIARTDAAAADTVILARAFPSAGATDPTQGFADALAAGGMAASFGWPILLTQTDELSAPTRQYLLDAGIARVEIMGGTAAISAGVEADLEAMGILTERVAGTNRAQTAIAAAEKRGAPGAADAAHVLLVQGQTADSWAGGFAAAARSALLDAPIVLAAEDELPKATRDWLADGATSMAFARAADAPVLTCVTVPSLCEEARIVLGLPPAGAVVPELVSVGLDGMASGGTDAAVDSSGMVVAFVSDRHVVEGVDDGLRHAYVTRYAEDGTDVTELVDVRPDGTPATSGITFSDGPLAVSGDGRFVAFTSPDPTLDSEGVQATSAAGYLRDLETGTTRLVTLDTDGELPSGRIFHVTVNDDGSVVAYRGQLRGSGGGFGIAVHDLSTGEVTIVQQPDGTPFVDGSGVGTPALSGDGRTVAFYTDLPLVDDDTNEAADTYVYDVVAGTLERVSVATDGAQADTDDFNDDGRLGISRDGTRVVFASGATNLAGGAQPESAGRDVYLHDRTTGTTTLLSALPDGTPAGSAQAPTISRDGRYAAFAAGPALTDSGETGCGTYLADLTSGDLRRLDRNPVTRGNNCARQIGVADDATVVFDTHSSFADVDTDTRPDVYRVSPAAPAR